MPQNNVCKKRVNLYKIVSIIFLVFYISEKINLRIKAGYYLSYRQIKMNDFCKNQYISLSF